MGKEIENKKNEEVNQGWLDDVDAELPEELQEGKKSGKPPQNVLKKKITLKVRDWTGGKDVKFKAALDDTGFFVPARCRRCTRSRDRPCPLLPAASF